MAVLNSLKEVSIKLRKNLIDWTDHEAEPRKADLKKGLENYYNEIKSTRMHRFIEKSIHTTKQPSNKNNYSTSSHNNEDELVRGVEGIDAIR